MAAYFAFIGPPGSGKTTQIRALRAAFSHSHFMIASVPRLVRQETELMNLLLPDERDELRSSLDAAHVARDRGELAPISLDRMLFRAISRVATDVFVALDGCPRGLRQAGLFLNIDALARRTVVAKFYFPDDTPSASLQRQFERERRKRGRATAQARLPIFQRKVEVYTQDTLPGVDRLACAGIPITRVDATWPPAAIHQIILDIAVAHRRKVSQSEFHPTTNGSTGSGGKSNPRIARIARKH
ncbi:MAG TPA: AAA family ATPase [Anaerolineae bacterium]|nr:AAA family ATPase [Anaerolineae bacterium]